MRAAEEKFMHSTVKHPGVLAPDDRQPGKAGKIYTDEIVASMVGQLHHNPGWHQRADLKPRNVTVWLRARAHLGLPGFLRQTAWDKNKKVIRIALPACFR